MKSEDLGYKFKKIHECFKASGNKRAKKFNLTQTQMHILHYLFRKENDATQRDIEKHFDLKHSTVIGILGRMEKNGFIRISVCENDRRQRTITLLQKAYDVQCECKEHRDYIEDKFRQNFTSDELSSLVYLLDKAYDILKEDREND